MIAVDDQQLVLEEIKGKNKKREVLQHTVLFNEIKSTKIQIVF